MIASIASVIGVVGESRSQSVVVWLLERQSVAQVAGSGEELLAGRLRTTLTVSIAYGSQVPEFSQGSRLALAVPVEADARFREQWLQSGHLRRP
jgi:hypothetical protein